MVDTDLVDHNQLISTDLFSKKTLKKVFLTSSGWVLLSFLASNFVRFATNIILTRFLVPADFGLMQIVMVFLAGCQMFIDLGVGVNILQSKHGENLKFLRTAWTVQVIRSFVIWIALLLTAWPASYIYDAPILKYLIPVAGLTVIMDGFSSTNLALLNKRMEFKKLVYLELVTAFLGALITIALTWIYQSVWALIWGMVIASLLKCVLSHLRMFGNPMAFLLDRATLKEIIHFGKWIFLSSLGGFLFGKIDRIILGLYLTKTELGLYGIAIAFPMIIVDLTISLGNKILVPLYSYFIHRHSPDLKTKSFKMRAVILGIVLPPLYIMAIWGDNIINFLYPVAYHGAGWILQLMAAGTTIRVIGLSLDPILISAGNSYRAMILIFSTTFLLLVGMFFGGYFYGINGMIVAVALSGLYFYPLIVLCVKKYGIWSPFLDLITFVVSCLIIGLGLFIFK